MLSLVEQAVMTGLAEMIGSGYATRPGFNPEISVGAYAKAFEGVALDLVKLAFERGLRSDETYVPPPGKLRALVAPELEDRVAAEETERVLRLPAPKLEMNGWKAATPEERAALDARLAVLRRILAAATLAVRPPYPRERTRDEDRPLYDPEQQRQQPLPPLRGLDEFRRRMNGHASPASLANCLDREAAD